MKDQLQSIIAVLELAQNNLAPRRPPAGDEDRELWDIYGAAITEAHQLLSAAARAQDAQQPQHITDGAACWCNPTIEDHESGNVIIHNYDDNWQQYAKEGETAQQCIERHRGEQDALLELLKQARAQQPQQYKCRACGTPEVSVAVTCHNSRCGAYANADTIYEGWTVQQSQAEPYRQMANELVRAGGRVRVDPVTGDVGFGTPKQQPQAEAVAWRCCPPGKCAYRHLNRTANCPRENLPASPQHAEASSPEHDCDCGRKWKHTAYGWVSTGIVE